MKKYEAYKPSGVEWIDVVPEEWIVGKIKFYANIIMGQSPDGKDITDEGIIPFMQGNAEFTEKYPNSIYYCETCNKHSRVGDVLMSVRAPVGELNMSDKIYGIGRGLCSIKANKELKTSFLWYYLIKSKDDFNSFANGSTFTAITVDDLKKFPIILPSSSEQTAIANYLDAKCAKIDNVVAVQQKRIELLKELKQSIITKAVTKGLDKTAKMKDSGIDWIGEVPEKWDVKKIKYNFKIYAGATPKTEKEDYWDGDIIWITPADYKTEDKFVVQGERNITEEGYDSCNTQIVPKGSIIFSKRAPIGTVALNGVELCTNQGCLSCVPICANSVYFYYVMSICTNTFDVLGSGATFKEISADAFANVKLPSPPLSEQTAIVAYLDKKCVTIDKQIAKVEKQIELLNEYKQSVITECVTGKRKVC